MSLPADRFAKDFGASFERFGFAMITDHGIDPALIDEAWTKAKAFFALPEEGKRGYHIAGGGGARGYTPFGPEIAKGAKAVDIKEFWHVGRHLQAGHRLAKKQPQTVWPKQYAGFTHTSDSLVHDFAHVRTQHTRGLAHTR